MPSDNSTVTTKADFAPTVVGETDRDRSVVSSASAHDGASQQRRPGVQQTQLNVLFLLTKTPAAQLLAPRAARLWGLDTPQ